MLPALRSPMDHILTVCLSGILESGDTRVSLISQAHVSQAITVSITRCESIFISRLSSNFVTALRI